MIPDVAVTAWSVAHPWPTPAQVEQDLLLSRAICAIAGHPYLGNELVFRGGTALHKLHLERGWRYSEDLDYVRSTSGGIRELTGALTSIGTDLGFTVRTRVNLHPKVYWRTVSHDGAPLRIKIEINTHERSPALPVTLLTHQVRSPWWTGRADVRTFAREELVATKIRALYQRSKGRDLFDLWLALTELGLDPRAIVRAFEPYRPSGMTAVRAADNLRAKVGNADFRGDLDALLVAVPHGYTVDAAAHLVTSELLDRL